MEEGEGWWCDERMKCVEEKGCFWSAEFGSESKGEGVNNEDDRKWVR